MPSQYSDPTGNINSTWGTYDYTYIDDGVRQPTVPSFGSAEQCQDFDKPGNIRQEWSCSDIPSVSGGTVDKWILWYYIVNTVPDDLISPDVRVSGTWKGSPTTSSYVSGWSYAEFSGGESLDSALTSMGVSLTSPSMSNGDQSDAVAAAYIECVYSTGGGGGSGTVVPIIVQEHWNQGYGKL